MSNLQVWSLASGSNGNCYLLQVGEALFLIDAGLSARRILAHLYWLRLSPTQIRGIFITHEHIDHVAGAEVLARQWQIPIITNAGTLCAAFPKGLDNPVIIFPTGGEISFDNLSVHSFPLYHDAVDPVGYTFLYEKKQITFVTDTGKLCPRLFQEMLTAHLLVLESNHDIALLKQGPYPEPLKARILSDQGHLSNIVAGEAVAQLAQEPLPRCIWLAHLSEVNNSPRLALNSVKSSLTGVRQDHLRVEVALRGRPSVCWNAQENWYQKKFF